MQTFQIFANLNLTTPKTVGQKTPLSEEIFKNYPADAA